MTTGLFAAKTLFAADRLHTVRAVEEPIPQKGFDATIVGQEAVIRYMPWQQTPASSLGQLVPEDRVFAQNNGDIRPEPGYNRPVGSFPTWNPLYAEKWVVQGGKLIEYDLANLSAHGNVERARLHDNALVRSAPGNPHVLNWEKPPAVDPVVPRSHRVLLAK